MAGEKGAENGAGKAPQKAKPNRWGPDNPPPKSPGRPPKAKKPPEPVLEEGLPANLAACRAAVAWNHEELPQDNLVRVYVDLKNRSPASFIDKLMKLENKFEEETRAKHAKLADPDAEEAPAASHEADLLPPDPVTDKVIGYIDAWLDRHRRKAVEEAAQILSGRPQ